MNDWNIFVILLNCGYVTWLAAFMTKKNCLAEVTHYYREYPSCTILLIFP